MSCNLHTALWYPLSSGILSGVPEKCFNMYCMDSRRGVPRESFAWCFNLIFKLILAPIYPSSAQQTFGICENISDMQGKWFSRLFFSSTANWNISFAFLSFWGTPCPRA
jgi:hypothetical protein